MIFYTLTLALILSSTMPVSGPKLPRIFCPTDDCTVYTICDTNFVYRCDGDNVFDVERQECVDPMVTTRVACQPSLPQEVDTFFNHVKTLLIALVPTLNETFVIVEENVKPVMTTALHMINFALGYLILYFNH